MKAEATVRAGYRSTIGIQVEFTLKDGEHVTAEVVHAGPYTLWLLVDGEDRFIQYSQVEEWHRG